MSETRDLTDRRARSQGNGDKNSADLDKEIDKMTLSEF